MCNIGQGYLKLQSHLFKKNNPQNTQNHAKFRKYQALNDAKIDLRSKIIYIFNYCHK